MDFLSVLPDVFEAAWPRPDHRQRRFREWHFRKTKGNRSRLEKPGDSFHRAGIRGKISSTLPHYHLISGNWIRKIRVSSVAEVFNNTIFVRFLQKSKKKNANDFIEILDNTELLIKILLKPKQKYYTIPFIIL